MEPPPQLSSWLCRWAKWRIKLDLNLQYFVQMEFACQQNVNKAMGLILYTKFTYHLYKVSINTRLESLYGQKNERISLCILNAYF
jgi:hypothetical protein